LALADKKISRYAFLLLKVGVSSALLIYLFSKVGGMEVIRNIVMISPLSFAAAVLLYIVASYISSIRWRLFLPYPLGMRWIFSTYMIGAFFNVCLPSTIGGDAVKVFYMNKELEAGRRDKKFDDRLDYPAISVASVFMDRYVGLASLLCVGMAASAAGYRLLEDSRVLWITPVIFGIFILGSALFLRFRIGSRIKFIGHMYEYFAPYLKQEKVIAKGLILSVVVQLMSILSIYILAIGIQVDISFLQLLVFVPLISLVTLVPVSISGFGLREGAFVVLLGTAGIRADLAMTLSILYFLSLAVASLVGLFEYLRFKQLFGGGVKEDSLKS
jgi:glycosyltransferase 2 family protein